MLHRRVLIGVLGTAAIASRSVIPAILGLPDRFKLVGVASRTAGRAATFARDTGFPSLEGYETLLDAKPDAVYIPLPTGLHHEWAGRALDRGIHVLSEKSLACRQSDVEDLVARADSARVVLMETFQYRFHSQFSWLRRSIENGILGELRAVRASFGFPPFSDANDIRYQRELGGGALLDAGAYTLHVSAEILGDEPSVMAAVLSSEPGREVDTHGGGMLCSRTSDVFSQVAFGFHNDYRCRLDVWGSSGSVRLDRIFTARPGFEPPATITRGGKAETRALPADNHFRKMLVAFHKMVTCGDWAEERRTILRQAQLLEAFRTKASR